MRVVVDLNRCQAYAQCVFLAPDVFVLHKSEESLIYNPQPDVKHRQDILRAAHACPVQAIVVEFRVDEDNAAQEVVGSVHTDDEKGVSI
jgi:ferredoxin